MIDQPAYDAHLETAAESEGLRIFFVCVNLAKKEAAPSANPKDPTYWAE